MSRPVLMQIIDDFIDASIDRLSSESGTMISHFFLALRMAFPDRQRMTQNLVDIAIEALVSRGLIVNQVVGGQIGVTVDLNRCHFNSQQARYFSAALGYVRETHGRCL